MKKIDRQKEPDFWREYRKLHPKEQYRNLEETAEGYELRYHIREYLIRSQYGLCAYCCHKIGLSNSLNEHIKPQSTYPNGEIQ